MKKIFSFRRTIFLSGMFLLGHSALAQYNPTATLPITINENNSVAVTDYQVLLTINTQAMVLAGTLQSSGADIRFGLDACLTDTLPHWIESGMNTSTTEIWVTIPSLPANGSIDIFMFGGDPLATDASNFNAVFPNAIITGGSNATVGGTAELGWLQVDINDTLFITSGAIADLSARVTVIEGVIMADGAGYAGGIIGPNTGSGTGGGGSSTNAGCGGGSYGNLGGTGGFDSGDTPGAGGAVYGTDTGFDIDAGSGGGASDNTAGGNGGGGINIRSEQITMSGAILANGTLGAATGGSRGGGGGSGGGVMLFGDVVNFSGSISANGGNGTVGASTANDDGGGGSGGRIKIFHNAASSLTGTTSVLGGVGGPNGSASGGIDGAIGTVHTAVEAFNPITFTLGTPTVPQTFSVTVSEADTSICLNDSLTFTAAGAGPFDFAINGSIVQSGVTNTYTSLTLIDGDLVTVSVPGCQIDFDITVFALPTPVITPSTMVAGCYGDTVVLTADSGYVSYDWTTLETTTSIEIYNSGTFEVDIIDTNGCPGNASYSASYIGTPPVISGTLTGCEGDILPLSIDGTVTSTINWSTAETTAGINVTSTGTVWVETLDNDGCTGTDTVDIVLNPLPTPTITEAGGVLDAGVGYSSYQWQLNGTDILGATSQTFTIVNGGDYTVTVTDGNGCNGTSAVFNSTVGLTNLEGLSISVQPNPFQDEISVSVKTSAQSEINLMLRNQQGQIIYNELVQLNSGNADVSLDLSRFSNGMYFIEVVGDTVRQIHKIIKQ